MPMAAFAKAPGTKLSGAPEEGANPIERAPRDHGPVLPLPRVFDRPPFNWRLRVEIARHNSFAMCGLRGRGGRVEDNVEHLRQLVRDVVLAVFVHFLVVVAVLDDLRHDVQLVQDGVELLDVARDVCQVVLSCVVRLEEVFLEDSDLLDAVFKDWLLASGEPDQRRISQIAKGLQ